MPGASFPTQGHTFKHPNQIGETTMNAFKLVQTTIK